jgi:hypothetical protein
MSTDYGQLIEEARRFVVMERDSREGVVMFVKRLADAVEELTAENERLHSWDGLMSILDEHYPADLIPTTYDDDPARDPGPRIVSLIRSVSELRTQLEAVRKYAEDRAAYGRRGRTVGSARIASDLFAILGAEVEGDKSNE